jgi:hypothetical protein
MDGATGAILRSWWSPTAGLTGPYPIGDLDSDGSEDIMVGWGAMVGWNAVRLYSGATGAEIGALWGVAGVAAGGDVNGDNVADIVTCIATSCTNCTTVVSLSTFTLATLPSAGISILEGGCGPVLHFAPMPILGVPCTVGVLGAQSQTAGVLFMSAPGSNPLPVGANCFAWVDPLTLIPLLPFVTNVSGNWFQPIQIAQHPAYAGLTLRMQAALVNPLVLTNALDLTLGY